jgi:hypothetical protein
VATIAASTVHAAENEYALRRGSPMPAAASLMVAQVFIAPELVVVEHATELRQAENN